MSIFETEYEEEYANQGESVLGHELEAELANELLEVQTEEELEQFLGDLVKKVAKGVGGFIKSPVGKALGGALKSVAKIVLPAAGAALGSFVAPGIGTAIGGKLGSVASNLFELELGGHGPRGGGVRGGEEVRALRLGRGAQRGARQPGRPAPVAGERRGGGRGPRDGAGPADRPATAPHPPRPATGGRWVRRGRRIVGAGGVRRGRPRSRARRPPRSRHRPRPCANRRATWLLEQEALALLTRLRQVRPFALQETMLPAAALTPTAQVGIDVLLVGGRRHLRRQVLEFLTWLRGPGRTARARRGAAPLHAGPPAVQRRPVAVRPVLERDLPAQRARERRLAGGPGRVRRRCAVAPWRALRPARGHLLPAAWSGRGDPPRADPASGRRGEPGRGRPGASRAHGRARHRLVAGPRGRPPGGGAAGSRAVAAAGAGRRRGRRPGARAPRLALLAALDLRGGR